MGKLYDSIFVVDGSQSVGVEDINVLDSKIDFLVFAGHKTLYAPYGIAGFIMNKSIKLTKTMLEVER